MSSIINGSTLHANRKLISIFAEQNQSFLFMNKQSHTHPKIKPISSLSLVDKVEIRLREYFEENNLKPGDSLPKELDLAQSLEVSRTVVREAFLRFRTLGLVESKKHRGMILTQPDVLSSFEKVLNPKILNYSTLQDIFEIRIALDIGLAGLVFARKTYKDIQELEDIVERAEQAEGIIAGFNAEHEMEFHGKLYQMSGNETLRRFQVLLVPIFQHVIDFHGKNNRNYQYPPDYVTHRKLAEVVKSGTPPEFTLAMENHLQPSLNGILALSHNAVNS